MMVGVDQITPMHFHWHKAEDIINRGGGQLVIQLYNSTPAEGLADSDVTISTDGVLRKVQADNCVVLNPGESITLPGDDVVHQGIDESRWPLLRTDFGLTGAQP